MTLDMRVLEYRQDSERMGRQSMGYKEPYTDEEMEIYECGYDAGFGDAMEKVEKEKYGERMGHRSSYYGERRGRDSRGRYM